MGKIARVAFVAHSLGEQNTHLLLCVFQIPNVFIIVKHIYIKIYYHKNLSM